jgi:hypothetical protein
MRCWAHGRASIPTAIPSLMKSWRRPHRCASTSTVRSPDPIQHPVKCRHCSSLAPMRACRLVRHSLLDMTELALVQNLHLPLLATLEPCAACAIRASRNRQASRDAEQEASKCQGAIHTVLSSRAGIRHGTAAKTTPSVLCSRRYLCGYCVNVGAPITSS